MPCQDDVARDQDAVPYEDDVAVGVPPEDFDAPAVELVAGIDELRVANPVNGVDEPLGVA